MTAARAAALVALAALAGCAFAQMASKGAARACARDSDCSTARDEICRVTDGSGTPAPATDGGSLMTNAGVCVIPSGASVGEVFLEIRPLAANLPVTQLGPIRLADGQNQQLLVPATVSVDGLVVYHATVPPQPVKRARLKFRQQSLIGDRPLVFEATSQADDGDAPGRFTRQVPAGRYDLVVFPPQLPNIDIKAPAERPFVDGFDVSTLAGRVNVLEVSNPNELVTFSGKATLQRDGRVVPAANLQVWAMGEAPARGSSPTGPLAQVGRPVAQPVTTDEDGRFTLWLPRTGDAGTAHKVRLQFGPGPDGAPFPTFLDPTVYEVDASGVKPAQAPTSAAIGTPIEVHGRVQYQDHGRTFGLANARVTFRTTDEARFLYSLTVLTDGSGNYTASLFPEAYSALALPPPDAEESIGLCPLETGADTRVRPEDARERSFLCEQRFPLFGAIRDLDDTATVPGVVVEAVRRRDALVPDEIRARTTTDGHGTFALNLMRGLYDLTFTPPPDRKLAIKLVRNIQMPASRDSGGGGAGSDSIVIELDPPFELFGRLFRGDVSHPLGASIEAYAVGADGTSLLVGQAVSKDDGSYSIVLPASAP